MKPPKLPFYVISDTHFFHDNIIRYCDRPYDHEVMMIKRWESIIKWDDVILHLGDLFFGGEWGYQKFKADIAHRLPGEKYIILGNHDKKTRDYEALGFTVVKPFSLEYRGYEVSFDHYPKLFPEDDRKRLHVHGHIHNHKYAREEEERGGNINVSVEVMDYRPHRATRLLNKAIRRLNQKQRYTNSRHVRTHRALRNRRYAMGS